jgi:hypothetical protein
VGDGSRMAAIVIPPAFSEAILTDAGGKIEVIVDPAREQESGVVIGQVQAATAGLLIDAEVTRGVRQAFSGGGDLFGLDGVSGTQAAKSAKNNRWRVNSWRLPMKSQFSLLKSSIRDE